MLRHRFTGWQVLVVGVAGLLAIFAVSSWAATGNDRHGDAVARAASRCKTYKIGHKKIRVCNGANGAPGPAGPQGPPGATGAPGRGVNFQLTQPANAAVTVLFSQNGVQIELGCPGGQLQLFVKALGSDHNIIEDTAFDNTSGGIPHGFSAPNFEQNTQLDMLAGDVGTHDYNGLLSVRTFTGQMTTIQWFAKGSGNTPQGFCVAGGTASY